MSDRQADLIALAERVFIQNYRQQPIVLVRGRGAEVWDAAGRRYLDMTAGIAVCGLGHAHPELTRRLAEQLERLVHVSNLYYNDQSILAADQIVRRAFAGRVFFCNSGSEANEAALKLARRWQAVVAGRPDRTTIVAAEGSFHGRSMATLAITGQPKYREGFGPLVEPVVHIPFADLDAAAAALEGRAACCLIVEPIQAEGGIVVPPAGYLAGLRQLCDATDTLLVFDEVQTGIGRTGRWFGYQHDDVIPDVMTLAKGLGGGVPIGAMLASERAAEGLAVRPGGAVPHASTFGGNPLACAAASAVFEILDAERLLENVRAVGDHLAGRLTELAARHPAAIREVRGRGLLRGLHLAGDLARVVGGCRQAGVLLSLAGPDVLRFAPPFVIEPHHVDEAVDVVDRVLGETSA
jgi:acetylornithine/N-succinyldiaminopimelate aminotransferase